MAVKIGSARRDENGKLSGGKAGDQDGVEVSTQNWYLHKKGWVVIRAKDREVGIKIAEAMKKACNNRAIGYDQNQRLTLYNNVKDMGFDPSKTTKNVETDCSALVRTCCAYAGIMVDDFYTGNEASKLKATGKFEVLTASKYTTSSDYLMKGDILVTKTKGHTVVVLEDGPKVSATVQSNEVNIDTEMKYVNYIGQITASSLYIRNKASQDSQILGDFNKGDYVWVTIEKNGWGYTNGRGWISLKYVKKQTVSVKGKVTAGALNVRNAAVNGDIIRVIPKNTEVAISKMNSDGTWGYDEKSRGWVSLKYIDLN